MDDTAYKNLLERLNEAILPIDDSNDYDALLEDIGDARIVLIGEATHGTEEFYQARMLISKRLIEEKGFNAIAIEGDWPDAFHIHRYVRGLDQKDSVDEALSYFTRFPQWMWRNTTMPPFLNWLRDYNDQLHEFNEKIGFYGLDLYSLNASIDAVISYLEKVDPESAKVAQRRYACFDHIATDPQAYGYLTQAGIKKDCIKEALNQLLDIQHQAKRYIAKDGIKAEEACFNAMQNARVVKDAEQYYRKMFEGRVSSWNLRDRHMADIVEILLDHIEKQLNCPAKIIIWAHNSHVGDARATEMGDKGEWNIGQLLREQHELNVYSIGFSTYQGSVAAADDWGEPVKVKQINPGLKGSYEAIFHALDSEQFMLCFAGKEKLKHYLGLPILQRAIGVIYRPDTERYSHYFFTRLPYQFDCVIHIDKTTALTPLD